MGKIREVIFDLDSTLYDYNVGHAEGMRRMEAYVQEHFGVGAERFNREYDRMFDELIQRLGRDNAATHSRTIRIQNLLENWGQPLFPHLKNLYEAYWNGLLDVCTPEPGSLECVSELRRMGLTVGIGTNMTVRMQYEKLEKLGFGPYISHIVTSQEAGAEKPSRLFMELCVRKSGVRPDECLFVGDNIMLDVAGALKAGMNAVWYNRMEQEIPAEFPYSAESYHEIRGYGELIPYLGCRHCL